MRPVRVERDAVSRLTSPSPLQAVQVVRHREAAAPSARQSSSATFQDARAAPAAGQQRIAAVHDRSRCWCTPCAPGRPARHGDGSSRKRERLAWVPVAHHDPVEALGRAVPRRDPDAVLAAPHRAHRRAQAHLARAGARGSPRRTCREPPSTVYQGGLRVSVSRPWFTKKLTKKRAGMSRMRSGVEYQMAAPMGARKWFVTALPEAPAPAGSRRSCRPAPRSPRAARAGRRGRSAGSPRAGVRSAGSSRFAGCANTPRGPFPANSSPQRPALHRERHLRRAAASRRARRRGRPGPGVGALVVDEEATVQWYVAPAVADQHGVRVPTRARLGVIQHHVASPLDPAGSPAARPEIPAPMTATLTAPDRACR